MKSCAPWGDVQRTGAQAQRLLEQALRALADRDLGLCEGVISGDDVVDALYPEGERRILYLSALQNPVASDLRLLTAPAAHQPALGAHGDQAVNLAKITMAANGLPQNPTVLRDLKQMGAVALGMVGRRWRPGRPRSCPGPSAARAGRSHR